MGQDRSLPRTLGWPVVGQSCHPVIRTMQLVYDAKQTLEITQRRREFTGMAWLVAHIEGALINLGRTQTDLMLTKAISAPPTALY